MSCECDAMNGWIETPGTSGTCMCDGDRYYTE